MAKNFPAKKGGAMPVKPEKGASPAGKQPPTGKGAIDPESVLQKLQIPQQFQQGFMGAVKACMHFVVTPATHQYFLNALKGPGPASQKIKEGVEQLLKIVVHQSKGQFPPQMYIPVGTYMITWVADYIRRAKLLPVTDQDVGLAVQMFMHTTLQGLDNAQKSGGVLGQKPAGGAPQPGQPPAPGGAQPPAPPPGPQPGPAMPKMTAPPSEAPGANPNLGPGSAPGPQQGLLQAKMG